MYTHTHTYTDVVNTHTQTNTLGGQQAYETNREWESCMDRTAPTTTVCNVWGVCRVMCGVVLQVWWVYLYCIESVLRVY